MKTAEANLRPEFIEPTRLIAFHPGPRAPCREEFVAALEALPTRPAGAMCSLPHEDPVLWNIAFDGPDGEPDTAIWCQAAQPLDPGALDEACAACRWVVGAEFILDREDPVAHLVRQTRLLCALVPATPGMLDPAACVARDRAALEHVFLSEPPRATEESLWTIHSTRDARDASAPVWLHTHGLCRCGQPELDMLEVPRPLEEAAVTMINAVAERLLEGEAATAGVPLLLGAGIEVVLQPWREVVDGLGDGVLGGMKDRGSSDDDAHRGVRAVICASRQRGVLRRQWVWPEEALRRLERDDAVLCRSSAATEREARLARAGWPLLARVGATLALSANREAMRTGEPHCVVKAGFADDGGDESCREHLWFIVTRFESGRALGTPIGPPALLKDLREGDERWIEPSAVSDWRFACRGRLHGPADIAALERLLGEKSRMEEET